MRFKRYSLETHFSCFGRFANKLGYPANNGRYRANKLLVTASNAPLLANKRLAPAKNLLTTQPHSLLFENPDRSVRALVGVFRF